MSLHYALLGLLNLKDMTGYELAKVFEESIGFFWSAQMSQVYRELNTLEKGGYVVSVIEPQEGKPDRRVYSTTDDGKSAFKQWLSQFPNTLKSPVRNEFLLRVFFGSGIELEEMAYEVKRYIKEYQKQLEELKKAEVLIKAYADFINDENARFFWSLTLRGGYMDAETSMKWAEECLRLIEKKMKGEKC